LKQKYWQGSWVTCGRYLAIGTSGSMWICSGVVHSAKIGFIIEYVWR
jgi:hypothetical protein